MEIFVLDKNFEISGIIDDYSSLVWNRKYYECGNFSLQTSIKNIEQFNNAKYIYSKEFEETGIIETFSINKTINGNKVMQKGRFLESILSQRVINETQYFKKMTTEDIVRSLVNTFVINAGNRKIKNIKLGERKGLGKIRTMQTKGDNLLDKIYELCKEDELSIKLRYDFESKEMIFEVWQGLDRRDNQKINSWAIFSRNFENILEDEYSTDNTKYCNFAYIEGEVEETEETKEDGTVETKKRRVNVTVNRIKEGEERKELYVDARDLQKDEETTEEEYLEILKERGISKLNEYKKVETTNFSIDPLSNLVYKQDFNLGDKVIYKNEQLNFCIENRIVEISEVYENSNKSLDITFGEDYKIKRK